MELKDLYAKKLDKKSLAECGAHVYETMESKWFATNKASASIWANRFGQNKYVGIRIPKSVLTNDLFVYHSINQDAIAAAYCIDINYLNANLTSMWFL